MLILEDDKLYEKGKFVKEFHLDEGHVSPKMCIIESFTSSWCSLEIDDVTDSDRRLIESINPGVDYLFALKGRFQMADTKNRNGRVYPSKIWEKLLTPGSRLLERVRSGEMLGECDHPKDGETLLSRVCCMTTSVWRNESNANEILGRMVVFNTARGRDLKALYEGGARFGVSSRGQGSLVRMDGSDIVQNDYVCETWDIVYGPSTPGAYPEVVNEETKKTKNPVSIKESVSMNGRLQELSERFDRFKDRLERTISPEALSVIREEVVLINENLDSIEDPKEVVKATRMVVEVTDVLREIDTKIKVDPIKAKKPIEEVFTRPKDSDNVLKILREGCPGRNSEDLSETLKEARSYYRSKYDIDGPLCVFETDALVRYTRETLEEKNKAPTSGIVSLSVRVGNLTESATVKELDAKDLDSEIQKLTEAHVGKTLILEIDRSTRVYEECAAKFTPLLETQTLKAAGAIDEAAKAKAGLTEISAQTAALRQVVEAMKIKVQEARSTIDEATNHTEAAKHLAEALADQLELERLVAAVEAIASTHGNIPDLVESLSAATSVEEVIKFTNRKILASLPSFTREPIGETHEKDIADAIRLSEQTHVQVQKNTRKPVTRKSRTGHSDRMLRLNKSLTEREGRSPRFNEGEI